VKREEREDSANKNGRTVIGGRSQACIFSATRERLTAET